MSLTNAMYAGGGGEGGAVDPPPTSVRYGIPALTGGADYATWRPVMQALLMRCGLEEAFTDELPERELEGRRPR